RAGSGLGPRVVQPVLGPGDRDRLGDLVRSAGLDHDGLCRGGDESGDQVPEGLAGRGAIRARGTVPPDLRQGRREAASLSPRDAAEVTRRALRVGAVAGALGWAAVALQLVLTVRLGLANDRTFVGAVLAYFDFFTVLTNILAALALT